MQSEWANDPNNRINGVDVYGWLPTLLPFVEQTGIYTEIHQGCQFASSVNPYPGDRLNATPGQQWVFTTAARSDNERTASPFYVSIPPFCCPSDGRSDAATGNNRTASGRNSYRICRGDAKIGWSWQEVRGMASSGVVGTNVTGTRLPPIKLGSIPDGTSNTLFASERCVSKANGDVAVASGIVNNFDNGGNTARPIDCANLRLPGNRLDQWNNGGYSNENGWRWCDSRAKFALFYTNLPPNAPACKDNDDHRGGYIPPSSYHPGGDTVVFSDAAARFVNDSINCGNLNDMPGQINGVDQPGFKPNDPHQWTGPSPYGVWGALGTKDAGDSGTL